MPPGMETSVREEWPRTANILVDLGGEGVEIRVTRSSAGLVSAEQQQSDGDWMKSGRRGERKNSGEAR